VPTADPAAQHTLLDLADVDRALEAAQHRRTSLPELAVIADGAGRIDELNGRLVLAQTEIGDLDRAARKLDDEIDSVRARAARDEERLASGSAPAKELENLQKEVESLARRQSSLEDDALELMERRETSDAAMAQIQADLDAVLADVNAATGRRDDAFADIDDELGRLTTRRGELTGGLPDDLLALYERVRATGKVAAGALTGERWGACRMALDRQFLEEIRTASPDSVQRCPECGAILVRG
jgi:predicted  nucleic acid-binding Zn-ribbon protein